MNKLKTRPSCNLHSTISIIHNTLSSIIPVQNLRQAKFKDISEMFAKIVSMYREIKFSGPAMLEYIINDR